MLVTKTSTVSGITRSKELDITKEQWDSWVFGNLLIQQAFPNLSAMDREFILSGCTQEEWDILAENEDDEDDGRNDDDLCFDQDTVSFNTDK